MPSNTERGYVLRRIMRRAIRFGVKIGLEKPFFHDTVASVIDEMGTAYPELVNRRTFILDVTRSEEARFRRTLSKGLALLNETISALGGKKTIDGQVAFELYDTFGFPVELTQLIADEQDIRVDMAGFRTAMAEAKERSRANSDGPNAQNITADLYALAEAHPTHFLGYTSDHYAGAEVIALMDSDGSPVPSLSGEGSVIVDATPFYAESGGQVGDTGHITASGCRAVVTDTRKPTGSLFVHTVNVKIGTLSTGDTVEMSVNAERRDRVRLNHTATHLLHAALRGVLGDHVMQKGSLVAPGRLRFDFSHPKAMTTEELERVEDIVYDYVLQNIALTTEIMPIGAAKAMGAMALFGEKYGDEVRVVQISRFSVELCGGTHVRSTGEIGLFRITSEAGISAGIRRIEALTGVDALGYTRTRDTALATAARALKTSPTELLVSIIKLLEFCK
jgi:alanyl-tRNA synthetase